jgi:prolyl 4-hydroxylase
MHAEYPNTRALGCIVQIASSPQNAEPWPIAVEDYEGNLNLVHLTAGDALLWESSKLYHGRPLPFIGNWTTAVVAFYVPLDEKFEVRIES